MDAAAKEHTSATIGDSLADELTRVMQLLPHFQRLSFSFSSNDNNGLCKIDKQKTKILKIDRNSLQISCVSSNYNQNSFFRLFIGFSS